ncbi:lipopolysaccharide heptosyltransferase II [Mesorhizobium sp. AR10]|uniref:lipopolysaccharide heptosyltransferase II n=1 Tax=Mesorhizobium sp. AR10 TaxID=2865839 RepID=UPI00215DEB22|nr:lipopolysaccharide heptosyltransferase II [Mesorhizobium sp. AR10]UVK37622.1 lipopolysaccharide heptosyltransferase II [Mesorhizobium sp. AR10]
MTTSDPILLVGFPAVGDFIRCHSAVQIIAQRFPGRPIDVVTSPVAAPLARMMPHVRKGWALAKRHRQLGFEERRRLVGELRKENYRTAYLMTSTTKAALMTFMAGIPERIGYPQELQFGLLNRFPAGWLGHLWAFGPRKTRIFEEVCSIASLGESPAAEAQWPAPRLVVDPAELDDWRKNQKIDAARPALSLYTAGVDDFRSWPVERFVSIARTYHERGWAIWIIGGARERAGAAQIRAAIPEAVDFTSTPSIDDAMRQIAASTMFLGVDGGISHAAAALNVPCALIYGLNRPYVHGPVNSHVRFLEPPLSTPSWVEDTRGVSEGRVLEALAGLSAEIRS